MLVFNSTHALGCSHGNCDGNCCNLWRIDAQLRRSSLFLARGYHSKRWYWILVLHHLVRFTNPILTNCSVSIFRCINFGSLFSARATVLPQKKHTHRMLYNFASSRPITLVFTHRPRYISPNSRKKN